jgi:hypothetical protein
MLSLLVKLFLVRRFDPWSVIACSGGQTGEALEWLSHPNP